MPAGKLYKIPRKAKEVPTKKQVKKMISTAVRQANPLKFKDKYSTNLAITTTAQVINLTNAISQGQSVNTRVADQIDMKWARFSATLIRNSSTGSTYDFDHIRVVLFKWFPDTATSTPTEGQILYDHTADDMNAPIELDRVEASKFRVLWDRRFLLGNRQTSATTHVNAGLPIAVDLPVKYFNSRKLGGVDFNTGAVTGKGHLYMMVLGSQNAGVNASSMRYHFSVKYDD